MRRSGSTLQYQLTARIVEEEGLGKRVEWVKPADFPIVKEKYKDYEGLKVFKSHIYTPEMGEEFYKKNALGVYIYRDIRDAFISQSSKNKISFNAMWLQNFLENAVENYDKWTSLPRVLVSKYEQVTADLPGEVQRIAAHIGLGYSEQKCRQIAKDYTLERQKERIAKSTQGDNLQEHNKIRFDSKELLHTNHILSGKEQRWKTELKPWQTALIQKKTGEWLIKNGYELSHEKLSAMDHVQMRVMERLSQLVKIVYYQKN
jgi:hypothetical protein